MISVLDIGTSKVACLIAYPNENRYSIAGVGLQSAQGMKSGSVADMKLVEESIRSAVLQAERMAGQQVREVFVSYACGEVRSRILRVEVPIHRGSIVDHDIYRLHDQCRGVIKQGTSKILHTIPVDYLVDGASGIDDPRQMVAYKLAADMHVIEVPSGPLRNLSLCVERCGFGVRCITVSAYASALATVDEEQMKLGVTLIDMGSGTTSVASFREGHLFHISSLPVGSHLITKDIAWGLSTSIPYAERLKTVYGNTIASPMDELEIIEVHRLDSDGHHEIVPIAKSILIGMITPRVEEILEDVREVLDQLGPAATAGHKILLTGGGSQLTGLVELAQRVLDKPVMLANHQGMRGIGSKATGHTLTSAAGLLRYADISCTFAVAHEDVHAGDGRTFLKRMTRWIR